MKSWSGGVVPAVVAIALAASVWLASDTRSRTQRADSEVARLQREVASARAESAAAADQVDALDQQVAALKQRLAAPDPRVAALRTTVRRLSDRSRRLVPRGTSVVQRHHLGGGRGEPRRVAVAWTTDADDLPRRSGVFVWEPAGGAVASPGVPGDWQLAFGINLLGGKRVTVGPASGATTAASDLLRAGIVDVGDVTGDRYSDLLTFEDSTGSGGCGTWRVVAASGGSMQQVFERDTCEADLSIHRDGLLRIRQAFQPPGCRHIHGCAIRTTLLRFEAGAWVRVGRRVAEI